jgi:hypothetical protein
MKNSLQIGPALAVFPKLDAGKSLISLALSFRSRRIGFGARRALYVL